MDHRGTQYGHPAPCDLVWEGVYIDDRALVAILRRGRSAEDRKLVAELVERTEAAYAEAGLVRHAAKEVWGAEAAVIWGFSVDGKRRTVRSAAVKLEEVVAVTLMALAEDRCSGRVLRRSAGLWVHHLLCRRPYLCLLESLFTEAESRRP